MNTPKSVLVDPRKRAFGAAKEEFASRGLFFGVESTPVQRFLRIEGNPSALPLAVNSFAGKVRAFISDKAKPVAGAVRSMKCMFSPQLAAQPAG
jgi:hypothetical protein